MKKDGVGCKLPAGYRTVHPGFGTCVYHLGATWAMVRRAERMKMEDLATKALRRFDLEVPDIHPEQALMVELKRSFMICAWYDQECRRLVESGASVIEQSEFGSYEAAWHKMFRAERDHLAKVARSAIDAGIAERQIQILETQALQLAEVIRAVLVELHLDETQSARAPAIVRSAIAAIEATAVPA